MRIAKSACNTWGFIFGILFLLVTQASAEPLSIKDWDPEGPERRLRENWTFYWNELLSPGETPKGSGVPLGTDLTWQNIIDPSTGKAFPSFGYGTYRLRFTGLEPRTEGYELFIRSAATAYEAKLYPEADPLRVVSLRNGIVGTTRDLSVPQAIPLGVNFFPENAKEVWVLSIQVSNFHHHRAGLWQIPIIGRADQLTLKNQHDRDGMIFSIGIVFVIGMYNLMIYLRRRTLYSSLTLALFCLIVAVRTLVTSDLLSYINPQPLLLLHNLKYFIEYTTIILAPFAYAVFVHFSFHRSSSVPGLMILGSIAAALCLLMGLTDPGIYTRGILLYQGMALAFIINVLYFLGKALIQRTEGSFLAFSGTIILSLAVIYDIFVIRGVFPPPFIAQYGVAIFVFMQSQVVAKRFATTFEAVERLTKNLQIEVDRQTADIRSLMDHVPLGIFMINSDLRIQKGYSLHLEQILELRHLEGKAALDALFQNSNLSAEKISITASILVAAIGESSLSWDMNANQLPSEFKRKSLQGEEQIIEVNWHSVLNKTEVIERILVTTRNVTSLRQLQVQAERSELDIALLMEMVQADPRGLHRFWPEADKIVTQVEQYFKPGLDDQPLRTHLSRMARDMHTLKGVARSLGLQRLTATVHDAETVIPRNAEWNLAPEQEQKLSGMSRLLTSYKTIYRLRLASPDTRSDRLAISRESLQQLEIAFEKQLIDDPYLKDNPAIVQAAKSLLLTYALPTMQDLCSETQAAATKLASDLGRAHPLVKGEGPLLAVMSSLADGLRGALLHLASNALAHGAESAEERRAAGKPPGAVISIQWQKEKDRPWVTIAIEDDGSGLNLPSIKQKAIEMGCLSAADDPNAQQVANCIFQEGLTTAKIVNQIIGRGIGMAAVRSVFEDHGGRIQVELFDTVSPQGFVRFRLVGSLPLARFLSPTPVKA